MNRTTAAAVLAIAAGAGIVYFGVRSAYAAPSSSKPSDPCAPFKWDVGRVRDAIEEELEAGESDPVVIASVVATDVYGVYPGTGQEVMYPPADNAKKAVKCIYEKVLSYVEQTLRTNQPAAKPFEVVQRHTSSSPLPGKMFHAIDANLEGTALLGTNGVMARALRAAGVPDTGTNRLRLLELTECSPYNHAVVNYPNVRASENFPGYGPGNSGILLNSQHYNNYQRMMEGRPARRSERSGGSRPFFWIPNIERNAPVVMLANNADGSPGHSPPDEILDFGLEGVPPGTYGCPPYAEQVLNEAFV